MTRLVPSDIKKTYPPRGPLQQFRFETATAFECFRCHQPKKSKLIVIYKGDWAKKLCNGCYGRLLSIYEIKAGTQSTDEKSEQLSLALLGIVAKDQQRRSEQLFKASELRSRYLTVESIRFIATSEHVAAHLDAEPGLEWSPAIIGLCKAVEVEVVESILRPLATTVSHDSLAMDKADKDVGRVAAFCSDPTRRPPEIGAVAHFLETVIHSERRRHSSSLIRAFLTMCGNMLGSDWVLSSTGLHDALVLLTTKFRNPAAHTEELGKQDYERCRDLVIGPSGLLWHLARSVKSHRDKTLF